MQIAEDAKPLALESRTRMERYRRQLLSAGMTEPSRWTSSSWHWLFYKPVTELTAFVVNLHGSNDFITVTYGYASTAFTRMSSDEDYLSKYGVWDEYITIHEVFLICSEDDESEATARIKHMHDTYLTTTKDQLLACGKEKRRAFLQRITNKLKPLGFKKSGNKWKHPLESGCFLLFEAQKSGFSDEYYFNIFICREGTDTHTCCYTRLSPPNMCPLDWQALTFDEFDFFLEKSVVPFLTEILNTPLHELAKLRHICEICRCSRDKCPDCWINGKKRFPFCKFPLKNTAP